MKQPSLYPWLLIAIVFAASLYVFTLIPDQGFTGNAIQNLPPTPLQLDEEGDTAGEMEGGTDTGDIGGGASGAGGTGSSSCDCDAEYRDCIFHTTFGLGCATSCNQVRDMEMANCLPNDTVCLNGCINRHRSCMVAPGPPPEPCGCVCQAQGNVPTCDKAKKECRQRCMDARGPQEHPK